MEPRRVLAALKFDERWEGGDPTPSHFKELIDRWGKGGSAGQVSYERMTAKRTREQNSSGWQ